MELKRHVGDVERQLLAAAAAGGGPQGLAERLVESVEPAVRLALLDALGVAVAEISRELAPGSVELRLRGGDPEFAVVMPALGIAEDIAQARGVDAMVDASEPGEGGVSRINLRLPEAVKAQVEAAARRDGSSVNAWLVRAAGTAARTGSAPGRDSRAPQGGQRYTGWGR